MNLINDILEIDKTLFLALNGFHHPLLDGFMYYVSKVWTWSPLYLAIIIGWIKKWKMESLWVILTVIVCLVLTDQLSNITKTFFERLRPSHNPEFEGLIHHVKGYVGGKFGFVSGHASNVFGFALLTSLIVKHSVYSVFIFMWAIMVSYSRIYLGVHYPLDIIGGMILGMTLAIIIYTIYIRVRRKLMAEIRNRFS
jgi:undecaprenyl-diphosphatase